MIVATTAEMIYQLTGSNMSSPQTAKMNAPARADTIDEWVNITVIEAIGWIIFFCWLYGSLWPIVGGGLAMSGMWGKYRYAITSGLREGGPATEDYTNPNAPYLSKGRKRGSRCYT
jgi:hypothetical protein